MLKEYKATGKFEVHGPDGKILKTDLYCNKIFKANKIKLAMRQVLPFMKKIMWKKYGLKAKLVQVSSIKITPVSPKTPSPKQSK